MQCVVSSTVPRRRRLVLFVTRSGPPLFLIPFSSATKHFVVIPSQTHGPVFLSAIGNRNGTTNNSLTLGIASRNCNEMTNLLWTPYLLNYRPTHGFLLLNCPMMTKEEQCIDTEFGEELSIYEYL